LLEFRVEKILIRVLTLKILLVLLLRVHEVYFRSKRILVIFKLTVSRDSLFLDGLSSF